MVVNAGYGGAEHHLTGNGTGLTTVSSLLPGLRQSIFGGQPPIEFGIAAEPWGSFAFRPGAVIAIAAAPGIGKTAFISQAAVDALRLNAAATVLNVNVEMLPEVILERQVARLSGVSYAQIARRSVTPSHHELVEDALTTLESIGDRLAFMGPPFSIERVVESVNVMQPRILILDYLQRITCCEGVADTRARLNNLMLEARQLASAGICVVLISAVGRTPSKKGGGYNANELGMGSFRESSEVEYGCDDAFVVVEEGVANVVTGCRTLVMRHVKSRNHRQQNLRLEFDGSIQRFRLLPSQGAAEGDPTANPVVSPADVRRCSGARLSPPPVLDSFLWDGTDPT